MDGESPRKPRKSLLRRLARALLGLTVVAAIAVAALPWIASTPPARQAIVAQLNKAIAPSKVAIGGLSLSWFGSNRLTSVSLTDGHGKTLLSAQRATLDRSLSALLRDHAHLGTITLDGATIDLERRADGSIDLVDALVPPKPADLAPDPAPSASKAAAAPPVDVTLRVTHGTLKLTTPELVEPLAADEFDMEVTYPSAPGSKLAWKLRLAKPPGGTSAETLGIDGDFDHQAPADPDLSLTLQGVRWPLAIQAPGAVVRGKLDGALKAARTAAAWSTSSTNTTCLDLDASGPALSGDKLAFDKVDASWDVRQDGAAWMIQALGLKCPAGTVSASGSFAASGLKSPEAHAEAQVDLAALAKQIPHTLRLQDGLTLEKGSAHVAVKVALKDGAQTATIDAQLSDLAARNAKHALQFEKPATISAAATRTDKTVTLDALAVETAFLEVNGAGDLDKGIKLTGSIDLAALESQFKDLIDFGGVKLAGKGKMAGDYRKATTPNGAGYLARYAAQVNGLNVVGLTNAPIARDAVRFDASVSGPAAPDGTPKDWDGLRVNVLAGPDKITLASRVKAGVTSVNALASLPVNVEQRDGRADVTLVGRLRAVPTTRFGVLEFDEFRATLRPSDPALVATGTVAVAATGLINLVSDDLRLKPLPLASGLPTSVAVGPEGFAYHGLLKTPLVENAAKGVLVGDLANIERALQVWMGREPGGYGGALVLKVGAGPGDARLNVGVTLAVDDLTMPAADGKTRRSEGPIVFVTGGGYAPDGARVTFDGLSLSTRYGRIDATGQIDQATTLRVADLAGTITPTWDAITKIAAENVEPNIKLAGKPRPFRVKGPLSGASLAAMLKGLDAEVAVELTAADAFGMRLGPAPIVVKGKNGAFTIDPIDTTLNGGTVKLLPGLDVDETRGIAVTLAKGSMIDGAQINDEVSHRLLTYVAPVLDKATHVHGKISMNLDAADIPVVAPPTRQLSLTGQLTFQDVMFAPGPFASQLLKMTGQANSQGLSLHQPLALEVANGRVIQKGLEFPLDKGTTLALEGSVGFDETLDMKASVPVTRALLGGVPGVGDAVGNRKIVVPINGTVSQPRVDKRALQVALRDLSKNVLSKEASKTASDLLKQLAPGASAGDGSPGAGDLKNLGGELLQGILPKRR